jgi:hypothetical protein
MKPSDVIKHFGSQHKVAKALNLSQPSVWLWVKRGRVPARRQAQLCALSRGKLKMSREAKSEIVAMASALAANNG